MFRKLSLSVAVMALCGAAAFSLQAAQLDTQERRLSYALGFQVAQQFKKENIRIDSVAFAAAVADVMEDNELQLTFNEMREALQMGHEALQKEREAQAQAKQAKAKEVLEAGSAFLEKNKSEPGVVVLPNGLQFVELVKGSGPTPSVDAKVEVHYRGTLINGQEFDSSYSRGQPAHFSLNGVIPGFREALSRMNKGAKWKVFIPSELGYGESGAGKEIGPNEVLIFEIELISFEQPKAE